MYTATLHSDLYYLKTPPLYSCLNILIVNLPFGVFKLRTHKKDDDYGYFVATNL